jgi:hypothetical protein
MIETNQMVISYVLIENVQVFLNVSSYVKDVLNRQHRRILSNFRSGCLLLAVETVLYTRPNIPLNERKCKFCSNNSVKDEIHFLLDCDFYSDLRYALTENACILFENFENLILEDNFIFSRVATKSNLAYNMMNGVRAAQLFPHNILRMKCLI